MPTPANNKLCYIAFSESRPSNSLYREIIKEALSEKGYIPISSEDKHLDLFDLNKTLFDNILLIIKQSDLVIADLTDHNPNVFYELGLANAWGKPTIILCKRSTYIPFGLSSHYPIFYFEKDLRKDGYLIKTLSDSIERIEKKIKLLDPTIERYINKKTTLSIELLSKELNIVEAQKFLSDILLFFRDKFDIKDLKLIESQSGSLTEILTSSESNIAKLVEKIIFFIPEWRRKKADRLKVEAETAKIIAETEQILSETKTKEALALLEIVERSKKLGAIRIVVGDKLQIETKDNGIIEITEPKKLTYKDQDIKRLDNE